MDNPIGSEGVVALAAPLKSHPTLEELNLATCEIGGRYQDDAGVLALMSGLRPPGRPVGFASLMVLSLEGNFISPAGCAALVIAAWPR